MDDKSKKGPQDSSRINVHEEYELRYWSGKFNISADDLKLAVKKVGVSASKVEEYLKEKR